MLKWAFSRGVCCAWALRVAVVGVGVAGSYLIARLGDEHRVEGFERLSEERYFPPCAWGTSIYEMRKLAKIVGLNFDDYVLYRGKEMLIELGGGLHSIKLKGLCTFDKLGFEKDLIGGHDIKFGMDVREPPKGNYDLIIDATGLNRSLLPRLKKQYLIPTLEYRVKYSDPPFSDFYIKPLPGLTGYLWYFPLGDGVVHVGAGDYFRRHVDVLREFMREHGGRILLKTGRSIRITPPALSQPFSQGRVVGVGEAIGTVYPLLGEGIIPSIHSAEILVRNLGDSEKYRKEILKAFAPYYTVFKFIKKGLTKTFKWGRDWHLLLKIYLHMRFKEKRYGIEVRFKDIVKVVRESWGGGGG